MPDFCVLLREPCAVFCKKCQVDLQIGCRAETVFWRFELRFCSLSVSLNNDALCEIVVC